MVKFSCFQIFAMKVGITGASGFLARHLIGALHARGHEAVAFTRSPGKPVPGCMETRGLSADQPPDVRGLDAVVNFAGESLLGPWTRAKRQRILASRVGTTTRLAAAMGRLREGPRVLLSASGVGFYGDRGDEVLDESKPAGSGFLTEVTGQWEAAASGAEKSGARVMRLRIGFVVGADGGAFPVLRRVFGLGLGGRLGSGRQWMSPIHVADVAGLIVFLLEDESDNGRAATGVFNAVCPEPLRNADFTRALGQALHRPALLPVPGFLLRGVMRDQSRLLLDSQRAVPKNALRLGYAFRFPTIAAMLADVCKTSDSP